MAKIKKLKNPAHYETVENMIDDWAEQGYDYIELGRIKPCKTTELVMGVDSLAIGFTRAPGVNGGVTSTSKVVHDSPMYFYPDSRRRGWGYLLDTPMNREMLARQLGKPKYIISDKKDRNDIINLAIKLGVSAEPEKRQDKSLDGYLAKSAENKAVIETSNENDELKAAIAKLTAQNAELLESAAKPLKGVKSPVRTTAKK